MDRSTAEEAGRGFVPTLSTALPLFPHPSSTPLFAPAPFPPISPLSPLNLAVKISYILLNPHRSAVDVSSGVSTFSSAFCRRAQEYVNDICLLKPQMGHHQTNCRLLRGNADAAAGNFSEGCCSRRKHGPSSSPLDDSNAVSSPKHHVEGTSHRH